MTTRRSPLAVAVLAAATVVGCSEVPPTAVGSTGVGTADAARAGGGKPSTQARYQLQFVGAGGIQSEPFPDGGIAMNVADPWKNVAAIGTVRLVNLDADAVTGLTAGGTWGSGSCRESAGDARMDGWDLTNELTDRQYSFAGTWHGEVALNRNQKTGQYNFYLQGPAVRVDDSAPGGAIRNIASNRNEVVTTQAEDGSWFEIRFSHAGMGFGSLSSPDGTITLDDAALPLYEIACASFVLRAERLP